MKPILDAYGSCLITVMALLIMMAGIALSKDAMAERYAETITEGMISPEELEDLDIEKLESFMEGLSEYHE